MLENLAPRYVICNSRTFKEHLIFDCYKRFYRFFAYSFPWKFSKISSLTPLSFVIHFAVFPWPILRYKNICSVLNFQYSLSASQIISIIVINLLRYRTRVYYIHTYVKIRNWRKTLKCTDFAVTNRLIVTKCRSKQGKKIDKMRNNRRVNNHPWLPFIGEGCVISLRN